MIGIYGGTFNPIHYGHLRTALEIKEKLAVDEIKLIPCYQPALKNQPSVTASMRLNMLQLAIEGHQGFSCDCREIERRGASYMVDTLASLRTELPKQSLVLLIGNDAFIHLEKWHRWQLLFDYAHVVVMTRPNSQQKRLNPFLKVRLADNAEQLKQTLAGHLYFQKVTQLAISSTEIRTLLSMKKSPHFLMPDSVINYIQQNKLYRNLNAN
ncbi:MAG: nicotinate-nucleotide adenylyltransferase [Methylococcales bacterium]|nr:nicotinate-nucleotide adenylyltransferase [Methylococcales bacterium]